MVPDVCDVDTARPLGPPTATGIQRLPSAPVDWPAYGDLAGGSPRGRPTGDGVKMSLAQELVRLSELHEQGRLTEAEFVSAKRRLIDAPPASPAGSAGSSRSDRSRTTRLLHRWVIGALSSVVLLAVIAAGMAIAVALRWHDYVLTDNGQALRDARATEEALGGWMAAGNFLQLLAGLLFVAWLFRLRRTLELAQDAPWRWSRWWAIFAWVTPVAQFFIPYRFVGELADRTGNGQRLLLRWWWATFTASLLLYAGVRALERSAGDPLAYYAVMAAAAGVAAVAGVLAVLVVRRLSTAASAEGAGTIVLARPARPDA
jgi:hypothetical protein